MVVDHVISYPEAIDAGSELIEYWLESIKSGHFTFVFEKDKELSIKNLERAKNSLD